MKNRRRKRDKPAGCLLPALCSVCILLSVVLLSMPKPEQKHKGEGWTIWEPVRFVLPNGLLNESSSPFAVKKPAKADTSNTPVKILMRNDTDFKIDPESILERNVKIELEGEGVQVVIVHTHGTEAYTPHGGDTYKESDEFRTLDETQNLLRVGQELKNALEARGIKTAHCRTLCDYPNYNGAYDRSFDAIEEMLSKYPEAKIVIDLHRDAVLTAGGGYYKATAQINGKNAAQILFVVGTDGGGLKHPNWRDNMSFQLQLHCRLEQLYPGITRPINIRAARFNQHFKTGSMLVEIGTCANYLEEALYSVNLFADALADILQNS